MLLKRSLALSKETPPYANWSCKCTSICSDILRGYVDQKWHSSVRSGISHFDAIAEILPSMSALELLVWAINSSRFAWFIGSSPCYKSDRIWNGRITMETIGLAGLEALATTVETLPSLKQLRLVLFYCFLLCHPASSLWPSFWRERYYICMTPLHHLSFRINLS